MAAMGAAGILMIAAAAIKSIGTIAQGQAKKDAADAKASLLEQQAKLREATAASKKIDAGQQRAAAQRNLIRRRREERLVRSRTQSLAAASGAGAMDPTIVDLLGKLSNEGAYRALYDLYTGEERARALEYAGDLDIAGASGDRYAAAAARAAGKKARNASFLSAGGTILSSASNMWSKYGSDGPGSTQTPSNPAIWWDDIDEAWG